MIVHLFVFCLHVHNSSVVEFVNYRYKQEAKKEVLQQHRVASVDLSSVCSV